LVLDKSKEVKLKLLITYMKT